MKNALVVAFGCFAGLSAANCAAPEPSEGTRSLATHPVLDLLADDAENWRLSNGKLEIDSSLSTTGEYALVIRDTESAFQLESTPFEVVRAIERVGIDVMLPEERASWSASLRASLDCRSKGVVAAAVGTVDLASSATGRFESVSWQLDPSLTQRLATGCTDLILRFSVLSDGRLPRIAVDGVALDYAVHADEEPLCGVVEAPYDPAEELPNGYLRRHSWRSGVATHFEIARIQEALSKEPEILGFAVDDVARRFFIVVDPDSPTPPADLAHHWEKLRPIIPLAVRPACRSRHEVEHAKQALEASGVPYTFDAASSRYEVIVPPNDQAGVRLAEQLGDIVVVTYKDIGLHGRLDDGIPHYGAAGIASITLGDCTGGFVADKAGVRGAVTAGHCGVVGDVFASGPYTWGEADSFAGAGWDMMFIRPQGPTETFSARIHTDPCCPATRPVTTKAAPYRWQVLCISGRNYGAKCSVTVTTLPTSMTISGVTYNNIWVGQRAGVAIGAPGDSGAPLYVPVGSGNAAIVGMHIGGLNVSPHDETWFHSVSDIETQLGVTVAY